VSASFSISFLIDIDARLLHHFGKTAQEAAHDTYTSLLAVIDGVYGAQNVVEKLEMRSDATDAPWLPFSGTLAYRSNSSLHECV
jgi:hypothetical protein